jgi:CheY-like chemotaxis protein
LLAIVSHELRTPLTPALFAASRLAESEGLPPHVKTLVATIRRNIEFEASLIDDLLDVARINRERLSLRTERVDLHDVLREVTEAASGLAAEKEVRMTVELLASRHHVEADRTRLGQVFWNLLRNAVKFSRSGGRIVVRSADVAGGGVRASIRDSGVGMDASTRKSLFAPFGRRLTENQSRGGLGLGLAICKGVMDAHGGKIWASSAGLGHGSTFAVELPALDSPAASPGQRTEQTATAVPRRVLVIEDDADSGEMLKMLLSHHGYEVDVASSLDAAVAKLAEGWDVVVSDIGLPDGSGLEVARRARRLSRPPQRLIALTGYGSCDDVQASREAGFDDHVVKPIDFDKFLVALNTRS